jgi:hypothetical protein
VFEPIVGRADHPSTRRAALATAWALPVLAVATPVPAIAASITGKLSFDTLNLYPAVYAGGKPTRLESKVQVQNRWVASGPTLTALTLTMTYSDLVVTGGSPTIVNGSGWSFAGVTHVGTTYVYSYSWSGSVPPASSTSELTVRVPLSATAPSGTVTVNAQASASGFTSATGSDNTRL